MQTKAIDSVDNEFGDNPYSDRQECGCKADGDIPENDRGAGFPDEVKNRGNILQRANAVGPGVAGGLLRTGLAWTGTTGRNRVSHDPGRSVCEQSGNAGFGGGALRGLAEAHFLRSSERGASLDI